MLDLIPFGIWFCSVWNQTNVFPILWAIPFCLGWRSPLIQILLNWPVRPFRLTQRSIHQNELPDEIHILLLEIVRTMFFALGYLNEEVFEVQSQLLWWKVLGILFETWIDLNFKDQDEMILNTKLRILIGSTIWVGWSHLWSLSSLLIGIYFVLEILIQYPLTIPNGH